MFTLPYLSSRKVSIFLCSFSFVKWQNPSKNYGATLLGKSWLSIIIWLNDKGVGAWPTSGALKMREWKMQEWKIQE